MLDKNNCLITPLSEFIKHSDSLQDTLPLTMSLVIYGYKEKSNELDNFIKNNGVNIKIKNKIKSFSLKYEDSFKHEKIKDKVDIFDSAIKTLPKSMLVSLVAEFDSFLRNTMRAVFEIKPDILNSSKKTFEVSDLLKFKNIEELNNRIIENEMDTVLYGSHTDQMKWFESIINEDFKKLDIWSKFIELTERRHLFIHCDGVVNNKYISICELNNFEFDNSIKTGKQLSVSPEYFSGAYNCLLEIAVILISFLMIKLIPDNVENVDSFINNTCFELICKKRYTLSYKILDFAINKIKKHPNETILNCLIINKALSKKLSGEKEEAYKIINDKDWSACSDDFKLAQNIILDKNEDALKIINKIGKNSDMIDKMSYRTWPLFQELRKDNKFKKIFKEIYNEECVTIEEELNKKLSNSKNKRNKKNLKITKDK